MSSDSELGTRGQESPLFIIVILLVGMVFWSGTSAHTSNAVASESTSGGTTAADSQLADLQRRQTQTQIDKLEAEIKSLQKQTEGGQLFDAQISKLRAEVRTLESQTSGGLYITGFLGAVSGLVAALIAGMVTLIGFKINRNIGEARQERSNNEKRLANETLLLGIFEHLGHEHARVQLASAAVLLGLLDYGLLKRMLKYEAEASQKGESENPLQGGTKPKYRWVKRTSRNDENENPFQERDLNAVSIVNVLLGILKEKVPMQESGPVISEKASDSGQIAVTDKAVDPLALRSMQKFIGDNLVKKLMAKPMNEKERFEDAEIQKREPFLHCLDWQGAQLENVWWKGVDARKIDLYEARLHKAGLSFAVLDNAVLFRADLSNAVLKEAKLKGAILAQANVCGSDLRSPSLEYANVDQAIYDDHTRFPDDYEPNEHYMIKAADKVKSEA